ncbi:MAG TPA: protein kinase [Gemmataceae bacterium]|nr:protein kinase [Gemmataceae bacterium]
MYETQAEIEAFFKCLYQFRFVRKLGEGAFGIAVLAYDTVEQIHKVFKLPHDRGTTEALVHEGMNLRKLRDLSHPNIIQLYQLGAVPMEWQGTTEERYYLNMAFGGTSLRSKLGPLRYELDENGNPTYTGGGQRLPLDEVLRVAIDVCRGLEAAHGFRGAPVRMIHRDVSPDNILIDDETGTARLSDFGIARVIDRSSALASFAGKLIYMDPFCFQGRANFQSDLYSLAIVLYEAATGELPFANFQQRLEGPPRPPHEVFAEIHPELSSILLRALANDLAARYATGSEMLADLCRLRARLNPLPPRYARVAGMEDGRVLCEDREAGGQVAVRLMCSTASQAELAGMRARLEALGQPGLEASLRDFRNEQFLGIAAPVPPEPLLADLCGGQSLSRLEAIKAACDVMADVCDLLEAAHRVGVCHGFLSPLAITLPPGGPRVHELGLGPLFRAWVPGTADDILQSVQGQFAYLSPRVAAGGNDPGPRDDVYSVGAILHALLTGKPPSGRPTAPANTAEPAPAPVTPIEPPVGLPQNKLREFDRSITLGAAKGGEPFAALLQQRLSPAVLPDVRPSQLRVVNPLIPQRVAELVDCCLARDPRLRPESAAAVAAVLRSCHWPEDTVDSMADDALRIFKPGGRPDALIEACDLIQLALRVDPGNPRAHFARGVVYLRNASYTFAVEEFDKAARIAPGLEVFSLLGQAHERLGQPKKAVAAYRKALEHGDSAEVRESLARLAPPPTPSPAEDDREEPGRVPREALVQELAKLPAHPAAALPLDRCADCGRAMARDETRVPGPGGGLQCLPCYQAQTVVPPPPPAARQVCSGCGRDASMEAKEIGPGEYLCTGCRSNPQQLITNLIERAHSNSAELVSIRGYSILRELGRGGMGAVYLARHNGTGHLVALKVMLPAVAVGPRARERFLREAENTRVLKHPHTVELREAGYSGGTFFFTMEYCDGGSAHQLLKAHGGPLPLDEATEIILQTLSGLQYAHQVEVPFVRRPDGSVGPGRGLVHRDLKPANLFLTGSGSARVVKIGDFGLAKAFEMAGLSGQTETSMMGGTPAFMPRQQALDFKYVEPEVDVWAAAASYYFLLTAQPPREFRPGQSQLRVVLETDPLPIARRCPTIPKRLAEVIDLALVDRPAIIVKTPAALKQLIEKA